MTLLAKSLRASLPFMMLALIGCQDDPGQTRGEGGTNHDASANGSVSGSNNNPENASGDAETANDNSAPASGFTPAQEASRAEQGAWSDVTQVTIIPQPPLDDVEDNTAQFCSLSYKAMGFVLVQLSDEKEYVSKCSEDPFNPYRPLLRQVREVTL